MDKKFTAEDMRRVANILEHGSFCTDAIAMLRQSADTYEKIEKQIKRLNDLLVPTCYNCRFGCAFANGKTHCENHRGNGSEVILVDKIKCLKELGNSKKV